MSEWIYLAIGFGMLAICPFLWRQREQRIDKAIDLWGEGIRKSEARRLTSSVIALVLLGLLTVTWGVVALLT